MKKLLSLITLVLLLSGYSLAAPVVYSYQIAKSFSAPGTQAGYIAGTGAAFHQLVWNVIGSISACSVRVDSSADGITYNVGDVIAAQDCSGNNNAISLSIIPNYVRINVVSFTGTGSLVTVLDGYTNNPSGATVSLTATSPVVITPSPTTGTGVISCPTCATGSSPVTSVFTRTGAVVAVANDYSIGQISGLGTGVATFLGTPSSANLAAAITDETGTGALVFANTPTLVTPNIGAATGTSLVLTGAVTTGSNGGSVGLVNIKGSTSGTASITSNATGDLIESANNATGFYGITNSGFPSFNIGGTTWTNVWQSVGNAVFSFKLAGREGLAWTSVSSDASATQDTGFSRSAAGIVSVDTSSIGNGLGTIKPALYATTTNCSSGASPAVCGSSSAGSVALPTGTNPTLQVNTTAVSANSQIILTVDESLGTKLGVTCNTTLSTLLNPVVTARTASTNFTFTIGAIIASNPACVSYEIKN